MMQRLKNTAGQHLMKSRNTIGFRFGILIVVFVIASGGILLWWHDATASVDPADSKPDTFVVEKGEGVKSIVSRLASDRLIRSSTGFYILIKYLGIEKKIQAGDYRINRAMNAEVIARELTHGILDIWVTTLEGWRVEEIATKLAKELDIPEAEFLKYADEGYMFPDTYLIERNASASSVAEVFRKTFDQKITSVMRSDAIKTGLPFIEVLTLASIVEREGRTDSDRPVIAGILLKRLKNDWPLQADATLQYALGYQSSDKTWWKKELTEVDKKIQSLYNTYLHTGLPPGPIANPGLASLQAVIYAKESDYWYYLHDTKGGAHFAKTIEEHNANVRKYLQ